MPLRNIDKYIKDKVQGYKPEYQEDLWKGIEEKLPAARVPNGRGSWLLTAAAVATVAILTPFIMKFYNLTERSQELALKTVAPDKAKNKNASDKNNIAIASIAPSSTSATVLHHNGHKLTKSYYYSQNKSSRKALAFANASSNSKSGNRISDNAVALGSQGISSDNSILANDKRTLRESMTNIFPENSKIETNDAASDIADNNSSRYPDRKSKHPIDNDKWDNWQSIYYPFWNNPAYTGSEGKLSFTSDYRTDNTTEPTSPNSPPNSRYTYFNIGGEYYNARTGLGAGLYRLSELSPYSLQNTIGFALSKAIQIGSTSVKIGFSGTSISNNLFFGVLNYSDQINPKFGFINPTSEKSILGTTQVFGANAGLWISNPHVMAGLDVTNANEPRPGFGSDATPLPREWRGTFGYRFAISNDFQFMPMTIVTRENKVNQANAMLMAVYKDRYMLSIAYQSINPTTGWGDPYVYGAVNIAKKIRVFASYGKDIELEQMGVNETFVHCGLAYQAIR